MLKNKLASRGTFPPNKRKRLKCQARLKAGMKFESDALAQRVVLKSEARGLDEHLLGSL